MPALDVGGAEALQGHVADVRDDLAIEQLAVAFGRARADVARRCPLLDPISDVPGDRDLRRVGVLAATDRDQDLGELDLGLALGSAADSDVARAALAVGPRRQVELERAS